MGGLNATVCASNTALWWTALQIHSICHSIHPSRHHTIVFATRKRAFALLCGAVHGRQYCLVDRTSLSGWRNPEDDNKKKNKETVCSQ